MSFETKVPYRVTAKTLKQWLEKNIGNDEAGKPLWSYEVSLFFFFSLFYRPRLLLVPKTPRLCVCV